ncbi:hypothetical protein EDD18DRAFT_1110005 [Armillaria luteobubalina]|uniref:Uncharacterized protein n=1 Tax=Armillaria luteobubalina TaxID=153913 RepID=A0AA39PT94_9AGAR|nr:hypothetical protein EDD18DRAFT_1110005 [Armillaria luteobubalina]
MLRRIFRYSNRNDNWLDFAAYGLKWSWAIMILRQLAFYAPSLDPRDKSALILCQDTNGPLSHVSPRLVDREVIPTLRVRPLPASLKNSADKYDPELLAGLRVAVTCSFIGCVFVCIYWDEIRKFCRANLAKLLTALVFCALLMQFDIWPSIPAILHALEGECPRSVLVGTRFIITSASRMIAIIMISHIILMLWRFDLYKLEILLLEIVFHRSLRIGEAVLIWLLNGRADGL